MGLIRFTRRRRAGFRSSERMGDAFPEAGRHVRRRRQRRRGIGGGRRHAVDAELGDVKLHSKESLDALLAVKNKTIWSINQLINF